MEGKVMWWMIRGTKGKVNRKGNGVGMWAGHEYGERGGKSRNNRYHYL